MRDGHHEPAGVERPEEWTIEDILELYGDHLFRLCCLYMPTREQAEDAFQETTIRIWKGLASFRGKSQIQTWLNRIAINTCKNHLSSSYFHFWKNAQPVEAIQEEAAAEEEPEDSILAALHSLPKKYREVLILHYYEEMSCEEIAKELKVPVNTVLTRLRRGRKRLEQKITEQGGKEQDGK